MTKPPTILVIDDHYAVMSSEANVFYDRTAFEEDHGHLGFEFVFCSAWNEELGVHTVDAAMTFISSLDTAPGVILLDVRFGEVDFLGLDILTVVSTHYPAVPVIMMTSTPKLELWGDSLERGAVDYLVKPIQPEILKQTVDRYHACEVPMWLVGQSATFLSSVDEASRAAEGGKSSILLLGDSGTGKELFARFIHRHGPHNAGPFGAIHIPSIAENLIEAELFGYSKGAFTGAARDEEGRLLRANGGILFLDEIGDLSLSTQAKLLRVLETREVIRLGDGRPSKLMVQVVAATNANLSQRVKENQFRLDLYSRLATAVIQLPRLSDRQSDIELLLRHFIRRAMLERAVPAHAILIPDAVLEALEGQSWVGNLRDLWNYAQRVLDLSRRDLPTKENYLASLGFSDHFLSERVERGLTIPDDDDRLLSLLPMATLRDAKTFIDRLLLQELSLLWSALQLTKDPVTGAVNRAKAVSLLKGKRCSTNEFDRWWHTVVDRLQPELRDRVTELFPKN